MMLGKEMMDDAGEGREQRRIVEWEGNKRKENACGMVVGVSMDHTTTSDPWRMTCSRAAANTVAERSSFNLGPVSTCYTAVGPLHHTFPLLHPFLPPNIYKNYTHKHTLESLLTSGGHLLPQLLCSDSSVR